MYNCKQFFQNMVAIVMFYTQEHKFQTVECLTYINFDTDRVKEFSALSKKKQSWFQQMHYDIRRSKISQ